MIQGFLQIYGVDFNRTFSPTVRRKLLWIFLAISWFFDFIIKQIDIVGAYLESLLSNNDFFIFMKLPPDFETCRAVQIGSGLVCRLFRNIYRLRQLRKLWNEKVIVFLGSFRFFTFNSDTSILIYYEKNSDNITMISIYMDNFLLASKHQTSTNWIKGKLKEEYNMKDFNNIKIIIGWQVTRKLGTLKID